MRIIHGTWIPEDPGEFVQNGAFYLWVESDETVRPRWRTGASMHPRHLVDAALETFLGEKLGIQSLSGGALTRTFTAKSFLLPTTDGVPLPSAEMLPYSDLAVPAAWDLSPWQICCHRVSYPIRALNDIHFTALSSAADFQLGNDLLFWYQYLQELKGIITGDHYIPSLKYRALASGKRKEKLPLFELYPGWELLSETYETAVRRYAACMPKACIAGAVAENRNFFSPETLLRHCSEHLLHHTVSGVPTTDKYDRQITGSLLYNCVHPDKPIPGSDQAIEEYREWSAWRAKLTTAQLGAGFCLGFRLEEAPSNDTDNWQVHFLAVSKRDPSLKLDLATYWSLPASEKKTLHTHFGSDFEKHLLLALGYAARMYPRVWEALETDKPLGFRLTLGEAFAFLNEDAWVLEDAGCTVIVPAWWTPEGRRRAKVRLKTAPRSGGTAAGRSYFSLDSVIEYQYQLSIGGEAVSEEEWGQLVAAKSPLVRFRGQWIELDRERMQQMLQFWRERQETQPEMTLPEILRLTAEGDGDLEWDHDDVLQDVLSRLTGKSAFEVVEDPDGFQGTLREYQRQGVAWLRYLEELGLNACLADDMGLGKTVQVIAQLVAERNEQAEVGPTLLIVPTSVLGNWRKEIERFAPHLRTMVHQGAARTKGEQAFQAACRECDVVVTSFALARLDEKLLRSFTWRRVVVDEAQNIKNPQSAQARAIAKLPARHRLALTGTPVENRLRDLWSIFNFLNPGYLGKEAQFRRSFELPIQRDNDVARSASLRKLVEPFILRRLKTDKRIIDDLPEKIEQKVYCNLTPEQASLYQAVVTDVSEELDHADGIQRKGLILATLTKLKQICNHPAHFLHDGSEFAGDRSHKLQRLAEMVEEIIDNGESLLIFTQFTEMGGALERYISRTLHFNTSFLHGGTSVKRREEMVAAFQDPESAPSVLILSVRAGGTGLTLTKANHVFHFDRWWNPAVEDQATDRAFRIGQSKNVFAHKFITMGTVEERIDQMIEDKKRLASTIVGTDESWLTELDTDTFKELIALQRSAVLE